MKVAIQKVGERDGRERFVLVDYKTHETITANDVSEPTLRKWLVSKGMDVAVINESFRKAKKRYDLDAAGNDDTDFDEFLNEIGLDE